METLDPLTLYILKTKKAEYGLYLYEFGRKAELYKRKKRSFSKIRTIDMKKNSLPVCSLWIALLEEHLNMPILSLDEANQNEKDQFQNYIDGRAIRLKQNITFLAWILCLLGLGLGFCCCAIFLGLSRIIIGFPLSWVDWSSWFFRSYCALVAFSWWKPTRSWRTIQASRSYSWQKAQNSNSSIH